MLSTWPGPFQQRYSSSSSLYPTEVQALFSHFCLFLVFTVFILLLSVSHLNSFHQKTGECGCHSDTCWLVLHLRGSRHLDSRDHQTSYPGCPPECLAILLPSQCPPSPSPFLVLVSERSWALELDRPESVSRLYHLAKCYNFPEASFLGSFICKMFHQAWFYENHRW